MSFFQIEKNRLLIDRLKAHGLQFEIIEEVGATNKLAGLTFVVSGTFNLISRNDLKKSIELNGAKLASSVSSKTDYLVAGENMGPSKLAKAEKHKVKLMSEGEYLELIG